MENDKRRDLTAELHNAPPWTLRDTHSGSRWTPKHSVVLFIRHPPALSRTRFCDPFRTREASTAMDQRPARICGSASFMLSWSNTKKWT